MGPVVVLELLVIVASGIDAYARQRPWPLRWAWWHLAPLFALWVAVFAGLAPAARRWAHRTVVEDQRREASVVLVERSPM